MKRLSRKKARLFRKNRQSKKYKSIKKKYDKKVLEAKKRFKTNCIDDVMTAKSGQWYSKLRRITNFDQEKGEVLQVDEINHLNDQDQAEAIADSFSSIRNEYDPVSREQITIPQFPKSSIPQFKPHTIRKYLKNINNKKIQQQLETFLPE